MLAQLHFLEPLWFFALIPLGLIWWRLANKKSSAKAWASVIDANLLPLLLQGEDRQASRFIKWLIGLAWLISVIALADPVWQKIPRPVFQTNTARVIVLDLSNSMLVNDLKPTRMARARFKVEDILAKEEEGQIGLVVFAGDAFTAAPLTRDSDTIRALLQVLTPNIMPSQGSRVDLGLDKAHELLTQAGVINGQVLLISDGASDLNKAIASAKALKKDSHTLSILAVGTETGGLLKLNRDQQVTVKLDLAGLHKMAKKGGGVLHTISSNDADLRAVLKKAVSNNTTDAKKTDDFKSEDWKSSGPFIILLLLPLAALAFRKGWLFNILISTALVTMIATPQPVMAASDESFTQQFKEQWKSFFQNREQKAAKAFNNKQYDEAINLSKNPLRKGSAEYKKGNYQDALETFKDSKGADARYNEGNTLAKLKKYEEAIKAYEEALKEQPSMADAKANKKALEDFLKKQQKQKNKNSKPDKNNKDQKDSDKNKNDKQSEKDGYKEKQDQKEQNKQGQNGKDGKDKKEGKDKDSKKNQFSDANKELEKKSGEKDQKNEDQVKSPKKGKEDKKDSDDKADKKSDDKKKNNKGKADNNKEAKADEQDDGTKNQAKALNKEEKMAAEQWLRRIPDDPGGLLRRKFKHQYRLRKRPNSNEQPW